jgi:hypothetical protein
LFFFFYCIFYDLPMYQYKVLFFKVFLSRVPLFVVL